MTEIETLMSIGFICVVWLYGYKVTTKRED